MVSLGDFDANTVEPAATFDPLPPGKYAAAIVDSQWKNTKSGTGSYLELTFQILEGRFKGRQLWIRLNLNNPSAQAVKIARSQLSAICRAVGVMRPKDSVELHNLPMTITVKCKQRPDTDETFNEIRGFAKRESLEGKPQQADDDTPPWMRP